jgi:putative superfamily III holin-X
MLKPAEPTPPPERPIGELVQELVDEGKAYARAELDLGKAIATTKAKALALPAGLLVAALFIVMAAINALAFGIVLALALLMGPLLGGIVGMLIFAAIAGGLAWYGVERLRRAL